jgi:predicted nucleic acid-binding protein
MQLYLDTSIWIDYYEKRGKRGEYALKLLKKAVTENFIILYSDLHIKELRHVGYSLEQIAGMFSILKPGCLRHAFISREQMLDGSRIGALRRLLKDDARHAIIARDNGATLVSWDRHFSKLRDIAETKTPEELL